MSKASTNSYRPGFVQGSPFRICWWQRILFLFSVFSFVPLQATANPFLDGILSAGWEDNLTRGFWSRDQHSTTFLSGTIAGGNLFQPAVNTSVIVGAVAAYHGYASLQGFNRLTLGGNITVQQKFGLGAYAPRAQLSAAVERHDLRGDERDRDLYSVGVGLSKRLTQSWSVSVNATRETSRGLHERDVDFSRLPYTPGITRPTDPMDYYNNVFAGSLDYEFASGWMLSGNYQYIDGYIVSTAVPPVVRLYLHAKAVAIDPAFQRRQLMYLLKSRSRVSGITLSVPYDEDTAVDVSYGRQSIDGAHIGTYRNFQIAVNLVHRF